MLETFILISILDSPEIEVDQTWIRTPKGIEAEVSCNIHAEPKAEVGTEILATFGLVL